MSSSSPASSAPAEGAAASGAAATVSFQCLPLTDLPREQLYAAVDRAIAVVAASGVPYQVGPMETTMEGDLDLLLDVVKRAHLACLEAGVPRVFTYVKIGSGKDTGTMADKVAPYRAKGH